MKPLRRPDRGLGRGFACLVLVVCTQIHLEPARWWRAHPAVSVLRITPQQSSAIDRVYDESLAAQRQASEEIMNLGVRVANSIDAGAFDDELVPLSEDLVRAQAAQYMLMKQVLDRTLHPLSPEQRQAFTRLVADGR